MTFATETYNTTWCQEKVTIVQNVLIAGTSERTDMTGERRMHDCKKCRCKPQEKKEYTESDGHNFCFKGHADASAGVVGEHCECWWEGYKCCECRKC